MDLKCISYPSCGVTEQGSALWLAHILNLGDYPLFIIHFEGRENDKHYGTSLIQIAVLRGISCDHMLMDRGSNSIKLTCINIC